MAYRTWCFTLNNYEESDAEFLVTCFTGVGYSRYVIGKEIAPVTGTPHLQGAVTFAKTVRLAKLKEFNDKVHWEKANARGNAPFDYCRKEGDFMNRS